MKPLTASERATFRTMTDAQLRCIVRQAERDASGELIDREALEAEDILLDRASETARGDFSKVQATLPADLSAHPMSGRLTEY